MKKTLKYLLFFAAFLCLGLHGLCTRKSGTSSLPGQMLNELRETLDHLVIRGQAVKTAKAVRPPPPGFCLPINDYLLPLFISGLLLGGFKLWKIEKNGPKPLEAENIKNDKNR